MVNSGMMSSSSAGSTPRWLGNPLMERLRAEIYELLEEAISWWGEQEIYNEMEG